MSFNKSLIVLIHYQLEAEKNEEISTTLHDMVNINDSGFIFFHNPYSLH